MTARRVWFAHLRVRPGQKSYFVAPGALVDRYDQTFIVCDGCGSWHLAPGGRAHTLRADAERDVALRVLGRT